MAKVTMGAFGRPLGAKTPRSFPARMAVGVTALLGLVLSVPAVAQPSMSAPPVVRVAPVQSKPVGINEEYTGRVQAIESVDIKARVEGYLKTVNFEDGSVAKEGDQLYQIDPAPYQASLDQANAELAAAKASVAGAEADLKNKNLELERQKTLAQRNVSSQAQEDKAEADRDVAAANLESAKAQVQQAEAAVATAKLNLSYTTIIAPITGRLGKTQVTQGALITPNTSTMVSLIQLDPIRVAFAVPSRAYTQLVQNTKGSDGPPRDLYKPSVTLSDGTAYDQEGKIVFANNQIDPSTDTLTVFAEFPNPRNLLLPGQFLVVAVAEVHQTVMPVIPATAVLRDQEGPYVFVLKADDTAEMRRITVDQRTENDVAVSKGLSQGETIIVSGVQKVQAGIKVKPIAAETPAKSASSSTPAASTSSASTPASGSAPAASAPASADASSSTPAPAAGAPSPAQSTGSAASSASAPAATAPASGNAGDSASSAAGSATAPASSAGGSAAQSQN